MTTLFLNDLKHIWNFSLVFGQYLVLIYQLDSSKATEKYTIITLINLVLKGNSESAVKLENIKV